MKIIFLDVDGVLNSNDRDEVFHGMIGIEDEKVHRLAEIVTKTGAEIVLSSSWRIDWERVESKQDLPLMGRYLVEKLEKYNLKILSKTDSINMSQRGVEIKTWIQNAEADGIDVESFCIIDDELFDYAEEGLTNHLVKTSFYDSPGGLQDTHVAQAIKILNNVKQTKLVD